MRGYIRRRGKASFEIQFDIASETGKRQRRFVSIKGTYKDAQKELTRLLTAADEGTLPDPSRETIAEYLCSWLDTAIGLSPKTIERYQQIANRQIVPHLGEAKLQKLKPEHLQRWHSELIGLGLSPRTVSHAHRLLHKVLATAVKNGTLARNVASVHAPPKIEDREMEILTPDQIATVLAALEGHTLYPIVALALATGARRGELLALQWRDVALDAGTLRIERSLEETKNGLRVKSPKTRRGRRTIGLPAASVAMLRAHKVAMLELRLKLGMGTIAPDTLVFSTVDGGLLSPDNLSRDWCRVRAAKGLPRVPFHAFRHTHVSLLIAEGVDILRISRRIGHARASTTLDRYGHLIAPDDAAAAKAIEGVLK